MKVRIIFIDGYQVCVELPAEAVVIENRTEARVRILEQEQKFIKVQTLRQDTDQELSLNLRLMDVSRSGVALRLNSEALHLFCIGDAITLLSFNDETIKNGIQATIRHLTQDHSEIKMGLSLEAPLDEALWRRLITSDRPVAFDSFEFIKDQEYRDTIHSKIPGLVARLTSQSHLSKFMKLLELQGNGDYLYRHITLLCEVTSYIGFKLGWVTANSLEKMIYVSYLHDIHYFDYPRLANIKSKAEFTLLQTQLTAQEIQVFLEGPKYSSELARTDPKASPDAVKILLQHRERSDGSGFPYGIDGTSLTPLTCLFIVCHDFVDYILERPRWSYAEFASCFRRIHQGAYFNKIFRIFDELNLELESFRVGTEH